MLSNIKPFLFNVLTRCQPCLQLARFVTHYQPEFDLLTFSRMLACHLYGEASVELPLASHTASSLTNSSFSTSYIATAHAPPPFVPLSYYPVTAPQVPAQVSAAGALAAVPNRGVPATPALPRALAQGGRALAHGGGFYHHLPLHQLPPPTPYAQLQAAGAAASWRGAAPLREQHPQRSRFERPQDSSLPHTQGMEGAALYRSTAAAAASRGAFMPDGRVIRGLQLGTGSTQAQQRSGQQNAPPRLAPCSDAGGAGRDRTREQPQNPAACRQVVGRGRAHWQGPPALTQGLWVPQAGSSGAGGPHSESEHCSAHGASRAPGMSAPARSAPTHANGIRHGADAAHRGVASAGATQDYAPDDEELLRELLDGDFMDGIADDFGHGLHQDPLGGLFSQ